MTRHIKLLMIVLFFGLIPRGLHSGIINNDEDSFPVTQSRMDDPNFIDKILSFIAERTGGDSSGQVLEAVCKQFNITTEQEKAQLLTCLAGASKAYEGAVMVERARELGNKINSYALKIRDTCSEFDDFFHQVCNKFQIEEDLQEEVWNFLDGVWKESKTTHTAQADDTTLTLACLLSETPEEDLKEQGYSEDQIKKAKSFIESQQKELQSKQRAVSIRRNSVVEHPDQRPRNGQSQELRSGRRRVRFATVDDTSAPSRFVVQELDGSFETDSPDRPTGAIRPSLMHRVVDHVQTTREDDDGATDAFIADSHLLFYYARNGDIKSLKKQRAIGAHMFVLDKKGLSMRDHASQGFDGAWGTDGDKKASCLKVIKWYDGIEKEKENTRKYLTIMWGGHTPWPSIRK